MFFLGLLQPRLRTYGTYDLDLFINRTFPADHRTQRAVDLDGVLGGGLAPGSHQGEHDQPRRTHRAVGVEGDVEGTMAAAAAVAAPGRGEA